MALGATSSEGSTGENLVHIAGFRLRVTGAGNLRFRLLSLDDLFGQTLNPFPMASLTNIEPMRLANFTQQRTRLEVKTTAIGEHFKINRIIVFAKPIYTGHPM